MHRPVKKQVSIAGSLILCAAFIGVIEFFLLADLAVGLNLNTVWLIAILSASSKFFGAIGFVIMLPKVDYFDNDNMYYNKK